MHVNHDIQSFLFAEDLFSKPNLILRLALISLVHLEPVYNLLHPSHWQVLVRVYLNQPKVTLSLFASSTSITNTFQSSSPSSIKQKAPSTLTLTISRICLSFELKSTISIGSSSPCINKNLHNTHRHPGSHSATKSSAHTRNWLEGVGLRSAWVRSCYWTLMSWCPGRSGAEPSALPSPSWRMTLLESILFLLVCRCPGSSRHPPMVRSMRHWSLLDSTESCMVSAGRRVSWPQCTSVLHIRRESCNKRSAAFQKSSSYNKLIFYQIQDRK